MKWCYKTKSQEVYLAMLLNVFILLMKLVPVNVVTKLPAHSQYVDILGILICREIKDKS